MPVKKIIVPINLESEPQYILDYASKLALASSSKISCICPLNERVTNNGDNRANLSLSKIHCLNIINDILYHKNVPYEVIMTKNRMSDNLYGFIPDKAILLIVLEITELKKHFLSVNKYQAPIIIFSKLETGN